MKTLVVSVCALLLSVAAVAAEVAQKETLRISSDGFYGKVLDASGKAVTGIAVTVAPKNSDSVKTSTNDEGAFRFGALAEGSYRLDVGGRLALNIEVSSNAKVSDVKVLYPEKDVKGAVVEWTPLIAGGVIVLTSVTVMAVVGSESRNVSP